MKQVVLDRHRQPEEVVRCAEVPDVGAPDPGEVVFDVLAFPINPADVSFRKGSYRLKPPLPATPGAECLGRVTAVGAGCYALMPTREEALAELSHVFNMIAEEFLERGTQLPEDTTEIVNA